MRIILPPDVNHIADDALAGAGAAAGRRSRPFRALALAPRIPAVGRNVAANALGRAWTMLMSLAFVPFVIAFLGVEAYGLVGFFVTLIALFSVLDLGLPTTLNRELARRAQNPEGRATMRAVVATLERVYAAVGLLVGALVALLAGPIAHRWLDAEALAPGEVEAAIRLMGVTIACQWPTGLYNGGLSGLERQVASNLLIAGTMTLRGAGALAVLALVEPSLTAFFAFQAAVSLAAMLLTRTVLLRALPAGPARFDPKVLAKVWRFAAGMSGVALVTVVLMQADKVAVSALLPLAAYAHFMLGATMGTAAGFLGLPFFNAVFPRFTALVAAGQQAELARLFHLQAKILAVLVWPTALVVVLFARTLAELWTGDAELARDVAPIARLLALGTALNAAMLVPYALILAHGKARYTLLANTLAAAVVVPLVIVLASRFGTVGAACAWPLLNLGYVALQAPLVLGWLMPGAFRRWLLRDVAAPAAAAAAAMAPLAALVPSGMPPLAGLAAAAVIGAAGLAAALWASGLRLARQGYGRRWRAGVFARGEGSPLALPGLADGQPFRTEGS